MHGDLVKRLLQFDFDFYRSFARDFSETRSPARLNLEPLIAPLTEVGSVLDVGCGNGRWAEALDRAGYKIRYVGVDAIPELIRAAKDRCERMHKVKAQFLVADLAAPNWRIVLEGMTDFDAALALAFLHHIPGTELQVKILQDLAALVHMGGTLVLSNWQFMSNPRLAGKVVPWAQAGIDATELDRGDYLLSWKRGGVGYRFVHLFTPEEIEALAMRTGWQVTSQFLSDQGMNLYSILRRRGVGGDVN